MADTERNIVIDIQTKTHQAVNDIKRLNKEIDKLNKQNQTFKKTTTQVNQMSRSFASLATHLGRLALIYGAFQGLQNTVRTFAEFEQSMKRLGVISGATEDDLALLEQRAKDLGESTVYSASQVAEGMNAMAMAGLTATQQLAGIDSVLSTATIGMITLEEATLISVRAMNAFGLKASDMGTISDIMATGVTNSAQTITELGNAYEKVGSVATAFNVSMEETTASLEIMADAGRVGSEAGTQLKIVLSRLAGNKEASKYIQQLGVDMYDGEKKLLPFKSQLVLLKGELGKLDEKARNIKLSEIFGEEGKATAIILLNNLDKYDTKLKQLQNSFGSASAKAQELQDTLIGSWKELQSALEGLAIKIGEELEPVLRSLIEDMTHFIQNLDDDEVANFAKSIGNLLTVMGDMVTAMVSVGGALASVAGGFQESTTISLGWATALGVLIYKIRGVGVALKAMALANPALTLVIASLTALNAILVVLEVSTRNFISRMSQSTGAINDSNDALAKYGDATQVFGALEANKGITTMTSLLKELEYEIQQNEKTIASYSGYTGLLTKAQWEQKLALEQQIRAQTQSSQSLRLAITALKAKGVELTRLRRLEIDAINKTRNAENQLSKDSQRATKEQLANIAKTITALEGRKATLETTLATMLKKEKKFVQDIEKLEQEINDIRKKYGDERASAELSLETLIANVRAKGMNDYQAYNDAQKRSEELLAKAKEAFALGNLEMAKTYLDEYDSLIQISAGEEIKVKDKVKVSAQATTAELERDAKASHKLNMDIINEQEKRDIDATNAKIDAKQLELDMMMMSIKMQEKILLLIADMISQATKVKFELQVEEFDADMVAMEAKVKAFTAKQRKIKIDGDLSGFETEVDKATKEVEAKAIEPEVDPQIDKAIIKMTGFEKQVGTDVRKPVNLDTDPAQKDDNVLITRVEIPAEKAVSLDADEAMSYNDRIVKVLSKNVIKMVEVYYTYPNGQPSGYMLGGLIGSQLPRYANGGLESGEGHSRKTGSLGGYGGGDKVKALLEAGEFIVRKEAVRALGIARLHAINSGVIPKFQHGGMVNPIQKFSTGGLTESNNSRKSGDTMELNLNLGGKTYSMVTQADVAYALARELKRGEF